MRPVSPGSAFALGLACAVAGCQDRSVTAEQAIDIGNTYMTSDGTPANLREWVIETVDMGDRWRISYDLPGAAGGHVIVVVNKRSGRIVHVEAEQ